VVIAIMQIQENSFHMKEIHCSNCGRFLCKLSFGELELKCPNSKCKVINRIRVDSYIQLLTAKPAEASIKL